MDTSRIPIVVGSITDTSPILQALQRTQDCEVKPVTGEPVDGVHLAPPAPKFKRFWPHHMKRLSKYSPNGQKAATTKLVRRAMEEST